MSDKIGTIDCSRFTREIADRNGYSIPRTAFAQAQYYKKHGEWTTKISEIQDGDHLFWLRGENLYHTGIAVFTSSGVLTAVQANVNRHRAPSIHQFKLNGNGEMAGFGQPFVGAGRPK